MITQDQEKTSNLLNGVLHICVTFHFSHNRLEFLKESISNAKELADIVHLTIVTNVSDSESIKRIKEVMPQDLETTQIIFPNLLGHPFFLTWIHFEIFREILATGKPGDYFLYKEDDITFTSDNVEYWNEGRSDLKGSLFYPSFVRFEQDSEQSPKFLTDVTKRSRLWRLPRVKVNESRCYINFVENYQGLYLLDREGLELHLNSQSSHPDNGDWGIREKATRGLSLHDVPKGYFSRNLVGINPLSKQIDPRALIRHLPNNYLEEPNSPHAKISVDECFL